MQDSLQSNNRSSKSSGNMMVVLLLIAICSWILILIVNTIAKQKQPPASHISPHSTIAPHIATNPPVEWPINPAVQQGGGHTNSPTTLAPASSNPTHSANYYEYHRQLPAHNEPVPVSAATMQLNHHNSRTNFLTPTEPFKGRQEFMNPIAAFQSFVK